MTRRMTKTIIVAGYGPGISNAVAERFGAEGFSVALVARNAERLAQGEKALVAKGVRARAFPADLGKPDAVRAMVAKVREAFGPITVVHWNAYGLGAGDLTTAPLAEVAGMFDVAIVGFVAAVQEALPDLQAQQGAVLATNGGLGFFDPRVDAAGADGNLMGLSVANSAKHKAVSLLAHKLKPAGVYVGEVMVTGLVKGTAFDRGGATLDPATIGRAFWDLYQGRDKTVVTV
jgi:NAD(P)-dependent dehydrogenase (short-subunit alcohol dehydrogenase family)